MDEITINKKDFLKEYEKYLNGDGVNAGQYHLFQGIWKASLKRTVKQLKSEFDRGYIGNFET